MPSTSTEYQSTTFGRVPNWLYRLQRFLRVRHVVVDGFRVLAYRTDIPKHVSSLLVRGDYESPERRAVAGLLVTEDRVLEIGTCVGLVALTAARVVGAQRVLTYEPNPFAAKVAMENFALNGLKIKIINRAIGSKTRSLDLRIGFGSWMGASALREIADARTVKVVVDEIGSVMAAFQPTVLVIDAEGMEGEILPSCHFGMLRAVVVEFHEDILGRDIIDDLRMLLSNHGLSLRKNLSYQTTEVWERVNGS